MSGKIEISPIVFAFYNVCAGMVLFVGGLTYAGIFHFGGM